MCVGRGRKDDYVVLRMLNDRMTKLTKPWSRSNPWSRPAAVGGLFLLGEDLLSCEAIHKHAVTRRHLLLCNVTHDTH